LELASAFRDIAADRENRIIILTGTGDEFIGPIANPGRDVYTEGGIAITPANIDLAHWQHRQMINSLLGIEVPIIAAVNGPATRHSELALMCDIVLAAEEATLEDTAHFHLGGLVPGDGINIIYTMLLGLNRARYFMLTGQVLSAIEAQALGLVNEVLPRRELMPRALELAVQLGRKPDVLLRYTKLAMVQPLKKAFADGLDYFMALETIGALGTHGPSH
jgi:enoyl-CoA hydratase/carnithine racemase